MGQFISKGSNNTGNSEVTIFGKVGDEAINVNDIVEVAEGGYLWPVENKLFASFSNAGDQVFNKLITNNVRIDYHSNDNYENNTNTKIIHDKINDVFFLIHPYDKTTHNPVGLVIEKRSRDGSLIAAFTIDSVSDISVNKLSKSAGMNIVLLANGNIAGIFTPNTGVSSYFVLDKNLQNYVVPLTSLTLKSLEISLIATSSGGFAMVYVVSTTSLRVKIFSNTNVNTATVDITGLRLSCDITELSNGNLAVCGVNTAQTFIGYTVLSSVGAIILNATNITSLPVITATYDTVFIASVNGYFCCMCEAVYTNTKQFAATVLSNAGGVLNTIQANHTGVNNTFNYSSSVLTNDGDGFWVGSYDAWLPTISNPPDTPPNGSIIFAYLPTDGNNANNKKIILDIAVMEIPIYYPSFANNASFFIKRNTLVFMALGSILSCELDANKNIKKQHIIVNDTLYPYSSIIPGGDGVVIAIGMANLYAYKYVDTVISGVAKTSIAAGNKDSILPVLSGEGSFLCNETSGQVAGFDQRSLNVNNGVANPIYSLTNMIYEGSYWRTMEDAGYNMDPVIPAGNAGPKLPGHAGIIYSNSLLLMK